jgi:hypothetical protein
LPDEAGATPRATLTFGNLVTVPVNQTVTLLTTKGLTFKGHCTPSATDASAPVAAISVAVNEDGCQYCSMNLYGGSIEQIDIAGGGGRARVRPPPVGFRSPGNEGRP